MQRKRHIVIQERIQAMSADYTREAEVALRAVGQAAILCDAVQKKITPDILEKKDRSPVTKADFGSQALISRALLEAFPNDPIIGEEDASELREPQQQAFREAIHDEFKALQIETTQDEILSWIDRCNAQQYSDRFWTLDPIDGTKGFLRKGQYAISLALIVEGKVVVAAVGCPNLPASVIDRNSDAGDNLEKQETGTLFTAVRGCGAEARSIWSLDNPISISVSAQNQPNKMRFCESVESGHSSHGHSAQVAKILGIAEEPVRLDSQAKYCVVARGEAEIYMRLPTRPGYQEKIWDHAGGVLVTEEAGGTVSDINGKQLDFTRGSELSENRGVIVTNGNVHQQVLDALREVGVE